MTLVWQILLTILIFLVLILVHEFGHFLAAKSTGIMVREFAIGFGPPLLRWRRGETHYSLRMIPFGGYNAMAGRRLKNCRLNRALRLPYVRKPLPTVKRLSWRYEPYSPGILYRKGGKLAV
ncbi:MAG: site-2 protease family protein [Firmicutes bacterium]|nr:site-2 protease family protein [Bacillota bacterium]